MKLREFKILIDRAVANLTDNMNPDVIVSHEHERYDMGYEIYQIDDVLQSKLDGETNLPIS